MSKKRYVVEGHPLGFDFAEIGGRSVGNEFEMDMDPTVEQILVSSGAIRILRQSKTEEKPKHEPKPEPKQEPEAEEKPEPDKSEASAKASAETKTTVSSGGKAKPGDAGKPSAADRR